MEDSKIQELILEKRKYESEISDLQKKIKEKIKLKKDLERIIFRNCKHNWVKDIKYYTYDERPNRCTKCNFVV